MQHVCSRFTTIKVWLPTHLAAMLHAASTMPPARPITHHEGRGPRLSVLGAQPGAVLDLGETKIADLGPPLAARGSSVTAPRLSHGVSKAGKS